MEYIIGVCDDKQAQVDLIKMKNVHFVNWQCHLVKQNHKEFYIQT